LAVPLFEPPLLDPPLLDPPLLLDPVLLEDEEPLDFFAAAELLLFFAVDFFAADEPLLFFAVDFFAADEPLLFFAVAFFAGDFFAVDDPAFLAVEEPPEEPVAFFAADVPAEAVLLVAFLAVEDAPPEEESSFFADLPGVTARAPLATAATVSSGSFFAPETTAFRSAPARNFGIAVFFAWIRSPVRGLRTQRASRTRFSKEPKPVMATFSPLATSRVIVSITESRACAAALRLPSKRSARVSIS
jgi:putative acetyltransferase